MHLHASTAARRILAAAAVTCAAALAPAAALAVPGHHTGAARTATPACATSGLDVWLDTNGSSAAGHTGYQLQFTNLSGSTCTLFGYPGASPGSRSPGLSWAARHPGMPAARTP